LSVVDGKSHHEAGATALTIFRADGSAMLLGDLSANSQAQSAATAASFGGKKIFENAG
jgi:hypothetical protein